MVTEKKWKILSDIGLDGHTKDGSILDMNLIFGKLILYIFLMKMIHLYFTNWTFRRLSYSMRVSYTGADPGPPKIGKNMIFWRKIVIFHTKYPKNFRAYLRSAQIF